MKEAGMDDIAWSRERGVAALTETQEWSDGRMYAIAFDLDTSSCQRLYPGSDWKHAYRDIQTVLTEFGFWGMQGSVYYSQHAKSVKVFQTIVALQERHPWFRSVVRSLRMLRIDENDDLLPILGQPELPLSPSRRKPSQPGALDLN